MKELSDEDKLARREIVRLAVVSLNSLIDSDEALYRQMLFTVIKGVLLSLAQDLNIETNEDAADSFTIIQDYNERQKLKDQNRQN